ncbi:hypothetical protein [Nonomuraea rhizosphaerae]|uniref:hypothetical protein n=1 Tax=Nonomuraea rhizosphaerae TaxID=2665663 RepID=UPI001C5EF7D6|nr:hypothetical protein [Nonomuraea rhizosphaerae]
MHVGGSDADDIGNHQSGGWTITWQGFSGGSPGSRSEAQLPINVGDASYDPLYPYGQSLRTILPATWLKAAHDRLADAYAQDDAVVPATRSRPRTSP